MNSHSTFLADTFAGSVDSQISHFRSYVFKTLLKVGVVTRYIVVRQCSIGVGRSSVAILNRLTLFTVGLLWRWSRFYFGASWGSVALFETWSAVVRCSWLLQREKNSTRYTPLNSIFMRFNIRVSSIVPSAMKWLIREKCESLFH